MFKKLATFVILTFGLLNNAWAVLTIEITEGVEGTSPIAIVPFEWQGKQAPPQDMAQIIAADLQRSGLFAPLPRQDLVAQPHEAKDIHFANWRALNVEHLVVGKMQQLGKDEFQIQFQLMDVYKGSQIAGYSIRSRSAGLRRTAHKISDIIYKSLTGTPGAFDTLIAYITVQTDKTGKRHYRLAVADSDGHDEQVILESSKPLMSPSWSPDGKRLAYVSFKNNRPEIYIQNIMTGQLQRVASYKGLNNAPVWSPDGNKLALTLSKDGNPEIYVLDLRSKRLERITRNYAIDTEAAWTPDGKSLVFTSDRGGSPQIYRKQLGYAGGRAERLTFEGNYNARASISADARYMTFIHRLNGRFRVAVMDRANGQMNLVTDSRLDESPSFSANGRMIIYATEDNYRGVLAAVSIDGRAQQRLSAQSGDVREPAWSSFKSD